MTISWDAFQQEALDCLRALVRLDTTNPPGNERIAADYMAEALGAHGDQHSFNANYAHFLKPLAETIVAQFGKPV